MKTTEPDWIDLGPVDAFPEGEPVLRKAGDRRFACVRVGDSVHALDDRCPHQGYPLSQGAASGGVLTCQWHNWKFDLATGSCTFGGEPVRRYPTRIDAGLVRLDRALDVDRETERLSAGVRAALVDEASARALREALRLGALRGEERRAGGLGDLASGFALLATDGAERAEYGFDHGLAMLADTCAWTERGWIDGADGFMLAATAIAEPSRHLGLRPIPNHDVADADDPTRVEADLVAERRADAEVRVRHLVRTRGTGVVVREALMPFVSKHLLDYGHGAIFLAKAMELATRFPSAAESLLAAATLELAWATAETLLPPFSATRAAMARLETVAVAPNGAGVDVDRRSFETAVLAGERDAVDAVIAALSRGAEPVALLRDVAHAAAVRLERFDASWARRLDAAVDVLDVTHAVTYAESAIALTRDGDARLAARMAVLAAGFVGKLRKADGPAPDGERGHATSLLDAVHARDARRAVELADALDGPARIGAYASLAPFAALDAATRPIFYAHTMKTTEALARLEAADPHADGAYLRACLSFIVPIRPERAFRRDAAVARKFLADGRPPEGLY